MTDVKCYGFLLDCIMTLLIFDDPEFQEFLFDTRQSKKFWREVSWYKSGLLRKMHLKFLTRWIKHLLDKTGKWGEVDVCRLHIRGV